MDGSSEGTQIDLARFADARARQRNDAMDRAAMMEVVIEDLQQEVASLKAQLAERP